MQDSPHFRKLLYELCRDFRRLEFQSGDVGIFIAVLSDCQTGYHLRYKCGIELFALDSDDVFHVVGIHIVVAENPGKRMARQRSTIFFIVACEGSGSPLQRMWHMLQSDASSANCATVCFSLSSCLYVLFIGPFACDLKYSAKLL